MGNFTNSSIPAGLVYLSVGLESIYPDSMRVMVMGQILQYLEAPIASVESNDNVVPEGLNISALYPNPSNRSISIEFQVLELSPIAYLTITDLMGREILKCLHHFQQKFKDIIGTD